ncbi:MULTISPECIES: DUF2690 domain-containing protein [Streptomyces]|uniref:DUF2690 domain-containing protein n=1 Tax=Streptomyces aurantiacus group TaxID=2838335 RepID=UPI00068B6A15|nr:DUF2690 domain-containing protein [Streptomyces yerevanensis]
MKSRTVIAATLLSFGAVAWGVPATAAPAAAAGTCYGSTCTGLEPNGTTCANDARNVRTTTSQGRTIILRYSPSCRAAWGKIIGASVGDRIDIANSKAPSDYYTSRVNSGSDAHTRMVNDAGYVANACGRTSSLASLGCTQVY